MSGNERFLTGDFYRQFRWQKIRFITFQHGRKVDRRFLYSFFIDARYRNFQLRRCIVKRCAMPLATTSRCIHNICIKSNSRTSFHFP